MIAAILLMRLATLDPSGYYGCLRSPRRIKQCNGWTLRAISRNVHWGAEPMVHLRDRRRTIRPSHDAPRTRSTRSPNAGSSVGVD